MRKIVRNTARLTPGDLWGLSIAYLYLAAAGWRLFVRKDKLERWILNESDSQNSGQPPLAEAEQRLMVRRARWVNAAARYPLPWARCLQRSLALCWWLERHGVQPQLRIGVRKEGAALQAHAWVEYQGVVINDRTNVARLFIIMNRANLGMDQSSLRWERR